MTTLRERCDRESPQLPLFSSARLERKYREHRARFPWVWSTLRNLALQARSRGRQRYSIAALFEVARWEQDTLGLDDEGWKLDNTMRAFYSRALMTENPDLAGLFETRRQRSV